MKDKVLTVAIVLAFIQLQGCEEYVPPEANNENCKKELNPFITSDLKFKSKEDKSRFDKECSDLRKKRSAETWDRWFSGEPKPEGALVKPEINQENCSQLYLEDNSFSKEHKDKFRTESDWKTFAEICRNEIDSTKPSPYRMDKIIK